MKTRKYTTKYALTIFFSGMMLASVPAHSAGVDKPYYTSQSQADVGYMAALNESDLTNKHLQEQMEIVSTARNQLSDMQSMGSASQINIAEKNLHNAEMMLTATISKISGISEKEIGKMGKSGMTWGQIGKEVGLNTHSRAQARDGNHGGQGDRNSSNMSNPSMSGNEMNAEDSRHTGSSNQKSGGSNMFQARTNNPDSSVKVSGSGMTDDHTQTQADNHFVEEMHSSNPNRLSPTEMNSDSLHSVEKNQNQQLMGEIAGSIHDQNNAAMAHQDTAEMAVATERNLMTGGVSGHGTGTNSGSHGDSGGMMNGTGGLSNGSSSEHSMGGEGSGGMGGTGGGMGDSGSGMGGSSGGSDSSGGGMGGSSGGGMGGDSDGGHGGSGGGGMM